MSRLDIKEYLRTKHLIIFLAFTASLVIIGFFSVLNRAQWMEPDLGLKFKINERGLVEIYPTKGGPAELAGAKNGDSLLMLEGLKFFRDGSIKKINWMVSERYKIITAIHYAGQKPLELYEKIEDIEELGKIAFELDDSSSIRLIVLRGNQPTKEINYLIEMARPSGQFGYYYLCLVGVLTLVIGIFVLLAKKPDVRGRILFYFFTLDTFVLFVFSYTRDVDLFARFIFYVDIIARILFAPLLLHLTLVLIGIKKGMKIIGKLIYVVPVGLILAEFGIHFYNQFFNRNSDYIANLNTQFLFIEKLELAALGIYTVITVLSILTNYIKTPSLILKKQLKLTLIGIGGGLIFFAIVYIPLQISGTPSPAVTTISGLLFLLLPISFSYAVIRYKLMDVELRLLRALGYIIPMIILMVVYFVILFLLLSLFPDYQTEALVIILALFTLLLGFVFDPLVKKIREFLDKILYRESYDFRKTLGEFSLELNSEHNIRELFYNLVQRIIVTFAVSKASAFLFNDERRTFELIVTYPRESEGKRHRKNKIRPSRTFSRVFSDQILLRKGAQRIMDYETMAQIKDEFIKDALVLEEYGGDYIIPLSYLNKVCAILTLSRKTNGDPLTSEDLELLDIIRLPAAVACENAVLIETLSEESRKNKELSEFNSTILESIRGAVVVLDKTGRVIQANRNFVDIFACNPLYIKNKNLRSILPRNMASSLFSQIDRSIFNEGKSFNLYKMPYSSQDKQYFFNISIMPLKTVEGYAGNVILFDDITEQAVLEEQLFRTDKLASLGLLAAGLAHEVNTPLAGISSYVQMMIKEAEKENKSVETLTQIEKQSTRIKNLIGRLLNFSRPGEIVYKDININDVIMETHELFGKQMEKAGVTFKFNLSKNLKPVYGDYSKLQQVLTNLLINAKDAIHDKGVIQISSNIDEDDAVITIEDDGVGISRDDLQKIYDPFFSTKQNRGGTGLGLSISYAIIREHLGTISVRSRLNEGTSFIIRLPLSRDEKMDKEK